MKCKNCNGTGLVDGLDSFGYGGVSLEKCEYCGGTGEVSNVVKITDTKTYDFHVTNNQSKEFLRMTPEGKIIFGDIVHENNVDEIAKEFIRIVEECSGFKK